jgi:hypothetical protein
MSDRPELRDRPDRDPEHSAPEGAVCAEHHERPASFTCPRCGNYVCLFCWHSVSQRCDACMKRDPAAAAQPVPWETQHGSFVARYFGTLVGAFRPVATAPAFARPGLRHALVFFVLSAVPLAALAGVIPNTKTLMFGSVFSVIVQGHPSSGAIALDVVLAMLLQLASFGLDFLALAVPYASLVRAYAPADRRPAALRVLLYRSWLAPCATLLFFLGLWMLPPGSRPDEPTHLLPALALLQFVFNLLLLISMRATARLACGIGALLSFIVVAVPLLVCGLAQLFVARLLGAM